MVIGIDGDSWNGCGKWTVGSGFNQLKYMKKKKESARERFISVLHLFH